MRSERTFQSEWTYSMRSICIPSFAFKIPDAGFRNPFDCFMIYNSKFYAFELKICKQKTCMNFHTMFYGREHEIKYLEMVQQSGGSSYIIINVFESRVVNKVYALHINDYLKYFVDKPQVKFEIDDRMQYFIELEQFKNVICKKYWDIKKLIKYNDNRISKEEV